MDIKLFFLVCMATTFLPSCFAGLSVSPSSLSFSIYGGEMVEKELVVFNDSATTTSVEMSSLVSNESGDLNGFSVSFYPKTFILPAGENAVVKAVFLIVPSISPEAYTVTITVSGVSGCPEPIYPGSNNGNGGSEHWVLTSVLHKKVEPPEPLEEIELPEPESEAPIISDENIAEPDTNAPKLISDKELVAFMPELAWWQTPLGLAFFAFIFTPCILGFITFAYFKKKQKEEKL